MRRAWWFLVLLVPATSGCVEPGKDYRVEGVEAKAWINGAYEYEDIRSAFAALGFKVDESDKPEVIGTNETMTLRSSYTRGFAVHEHPNTWTLTAMYHWDEDRFGERKWHDESGPAWKQAQPLWESARWHFHAFLDEVTAQHPAWAGTPDRDIKIRLDSRTDYTEPEIE